jgi:hypothetical protein
MFAAEPPQEPLPYGRWAEALAEQFLERARAEADSAIGEVCGYVSYSREHEGAQATDFNALAYSTEDTAADNPDWTLDLNDEEIGIYRGPQGRRGKITLVWGVALVPNGAVATAELGPTTTDQCELVDDLFTLVSLDDYTGDYVEVRLYGQKGDELALEPLYEED